MTLHLSSSNTSSSSPACVKVSRFLFNKEQKDTFPGFFWCLYVDSHLLLQDEQQVSSQTAEPLCETCESTERLTDFWTLRWKNLSKGSSAEPRFLSWPLDCESGNCSTGGDSEVPGSKVRVSQAGDGNRRRWLQSRREKRYKTKEKKTTETWEIRSEHTKNRTKDQKRELVQK